MKTTPHHTTYITRVLPAAALFALSAMPAAMAQTVFSYGSSDFNLSANWSDGLPGENSSQNAVLQGAAGTSATTTADYTNANGDPINHNWNLTPRNYTTLNINHNMETGAAAGANAGNIYLATNTTGGTIVQAAGTTVTTGGAFIGNSTDRSGTNYADYTLNGTLDATSINLGKSGRLRVGATGYTDAPITHNGTSGGVHNGALTGTGVGGELAGLVTLNGNLDVRGVGGATGLIFSGGIQSSADQSLGINGRHIINTNAVDLNAGTIGFTSNGTDAANASEINVGGVGVNDWNLMTLNFSGYVKMGADNVTPVDSGIRFGFVNDGFSTGTFDLNGFDQTVASLSHFQAGVNGDNTITDTGGTGTLTVNQSTNTEYRGNFEGGLGLIKEGAGTLILNNLSGTNSTYAGTTTISGGVLDIRSADALGSTAGETIIGNGAKLVISGGITTAENITNTGGGGGKITGGTGGGTFTGLITLTNAIDLRGDDLTFSGGVTSLDQGFGINGARYVIDTNAIDLDSDNSGGAGSFGVTSAGNDLAKATQLNVGGNDWGQTTLNFTGVLRVGGNDYMPTDTDVVFGWFNPGQHGGILDLYGSNQTVASIATRSAALGELNNGNDRQEITSSIGASTLTVNQNTNTEFQGQITGGISLVKSGSGTLTLNVDDDLNNSYTGTTSVNGGTLALAHATSTNIISSSAVIDVASGATLDVSGITNGFALANGQTLSGAGSVVGGTTVGTGAILSPGNSPGTQTFDNLTWVNGGTYLWEINADSLNGGSGLSFRCA